VCWGDACWHNVQAVVSVAQRVNIGYHIHRHTYKCEIPKCLPSAIGFNFAVDARPSSFVFRCLECFSTAIDLAVPGYPCMQTRPFLAFLMVALFTSATVAQNSAPPREAARKPVRVLLVVAHPDDEYEVAGTVYRISKELLGTVDQVIITDGEAGYRYSSLAAPYYGIDLTNEAIGRTRLPRIRREEARRAGRILGIQHQWFLNEKDDQFTLDADASLYHGWHEQRILHVLHQRLSKGHYDFVFVLLPSEQTHGGHKAASILALEAVEQLPASRRPIVLGAQAGEGDPAPYKSLSGYPLTASDSLNPQFQFDRNTRFGYQESRSYQIVVDWVIAEHKSQGLFQTRCLQDRFENFWLFTLNRNSAAGEAESLFAAVTPGPESARETGIAGTAKPQ
jgi:N-acetylglucosamine malate deacetylase 2